jgi:hypothetical protein
LGFLTFLQSSGQNADLLFEIGYVILALPYHRASEPIIGSGNKEMLMKHLVCCILASLILSTAALATPPLAMHASGTILSDGPMPYPGPTPPVGN